VFCTSSAVPLPLAIVFVAPVIVRCPAFVTRIPGALLVTCTLLSVNVVLGLECSSMPGPVPSAPPSVTSTFVITTLFGDAPAAFANSPPLPAPDGSTFNERTRTPDERVSTSGPALVSVGRAPAGTSSLDPVGVPVGPRSTVSAWPCPSRVTFGPRTDPAVVRPEPV
jgi:hypothetical protein